MDVVTSSDLDFRLVAQVAPNGIWAAAANPAVTAIVVAAAPARKPVVGVLRAVPALFPSSPAF